MGVVAGVKIWVKVGVKVVARAWLELPGLE